MSVLDFFRQRKADLDELAKKRQQARKGKGRIRIKSRINEVLDSLSITLMFEDIVSTDPLEFPGYAEKTAELVRRCGRSDAFICARGNIQGCPVICVELLPEFLMGSMGTAVGEAVSRSTEYAQEQGLPLIIFSASGGARMQEGMFSLMQMAKTSAAVRRLSDSGGLYISVLTHPTTGGVTASFASLGDIIIAEPEALIGFAGPRVIEQTIRAKLPEGFQSAEFQRDNGFVDIIVKRLELRDTLARLLRLHGLETRKTRDMREAREAREAQAVREAREAQAAKAAQEAQAAQATREAQAALGAQAAQTAAHVAQALEAAPEAGTDSNSIEVQPGQQLTFGMQKTPAEHVEIARNSKRPHAKAFIDTLFDDFIELHGDRLFRDDPSMICGLASFEGRPVTVAAHLKGADLEENINSNFGMPNPEGYRKFIRLIRQAEKFNRPVITLIDTPGAYPGAEAEERGQGEAIARCLFELSGLRVPTIAVVTGEGGSGGALALGLCDRVLMYEYAIYSVLSPEGFASILWKDAKRAKDASEVMKLTAQDLKGFGMIDDIIKEPLDGAHNDPLAAIEALRPNLRSVLHELIAKDKDQLLEERYQKYRKFM